MGRKKLSVADETAAVAEARRFVDGDPNGDRLLVDRNELAEVVGELERIARAAGKTTALGGNTLAIEAQNDVVTLHAADVRADLWLSARLQNHIPISGHVFAFVPAKAAKAFLTKAAEEIKIIIEGSTKPVEVVERDGTTVRLQRIVSPPDAAAFDVASVVATKAKLAALVPEPKLVAADIDYVLRAVCTDETRYNLNGLRFDPPSKRCSVLRVVSTDGHRLHLTKAVQPMSAGDAVLIDWFGDGVKPFTVPALAATTLARLLKAQPKDAKPFKIAVHTTKEYVHVVFSSERWTLIARTIPDEYPEFDEVIPDRFTGSATVLNPARLIDNVKRIDKLCSGKMRVTAETGRLVLSGEDPDTGTIEVGLPAADVVVPHVPVMVNGEPTAERVPAVLGVNPKYVVQALDAKQGDVLVQFEDEHSPFKFTQADKPQRLAVVMPMRL